MKYTIISKEFGKIEIDDEKMVAYFFESDIEYNIKDGYFHDILERSFHVVWLGKEIILEVMWMKEVGRARGK